MEKKGFTLWVTGLSASGKTTISRHVTSYLKDHYKITPLLLDGDKMRNIFGNDFGFDRDSRIKLASIYGRLCQEMTDQGHVVICATISMFEEIRQWNRENIQNYVECFLDVPLPELERRNPKGHYKSGKKNLVGFDLDAQLPANSHIHVKNYDEISEQDCARIIISYLEEKGFLKF